LGRTDPLTLASLIALKNLENFPDQGHLVVHFLS